jgi:hypothetical protein
MSLRHTARNAGVWFVRLNYPVVLTGVRLLASVWAWIYGINSKKIITKRYLLLYNSKYLRMPSRRGDDGSRGKINREDPTDFYGRKLSFPPAGKD